MRRDFVKDSARKLKMRGDGTLPAAFMPQRLYEPDVTAGGTQNFFPRGFLRGVCAGIQHENKNALPAEKHPDCRLHASLCKWQPGRFSASAHFLCWILGFCSIKKKIILKQFT